MPGKSEDEMSVSYKDNNINAENEINAISEESGQQHP